MSGPAAGADAYPWSPAAPDAGQQRSIRPAAAAADESGDLDDDESETGIVPGFEPPTS
jgi:hypothetical protein